MLEVGVWVWWRLHGGDDIDPMLCKTMDLDEEDSDYDYRLSRFVPEPDSYMFAYADEVTEVFPEAEVISL